MPEATTRPGTQDDHPEAPEPGARRAVRPARGRRAAGRRLARLVLPLAVLGSGALVYQASNAAFTATTSNAGNSWTAGNVFLNDSQNGTALFTVTGLKPGATNAQSKCIKVNYTGNLAASVKMYVSSWSELARPAGPPGPTGAGSYPPSPYIRFVIEPGTGNQSACGDFSGSGTYVTSGTTNGQAFSSLQALNAWTVAYPGTATAWSVPASSVASPTSMTFKITYWMPDTTDTNAPSQAILDDLQGAKLSGDFTWEARNT